MIGRIFRLEALFLLSLSVQLLQRRSADIWQGIIYFGIKKPDEYPIILLERLPC
jgi:hypothetical protein